MVATTTHNNPNSSVQYSAAQEDSVQKYYAQ